MKKVGSYGRGFLSRIKRSAGDVLAYRWHDDGRERKRILGLASKFKSEASAWKVLSLRFPWSSQAHPSSSARLCR
jgi:hypothetical protein